MSRFYPADLVHIQYTYKIYINYVHKIFIKKTKVCSFIYHIYIIYIILYNTYNIYNIYGEGEQYAEPAN